MDLFNIACKTCNTYLGADWFEDTDTALKSKKDCGIKDCKTEIIVYP